MLNNAAIMGRLGREIDLRRTNSGKAVASFALAVDRDFKSQSGEKETDWINCVAWSQSAEYLANYASVGSIIAVTGRLQVRQWEDKDGNKRTTTEIVARNVYIVGGKGNSGTNSSDRLANLENRVSDAYAGEKNDWSEVDVDESELPF